MNANSVIQKTKISKLGQNSGLKISVYMKKRRPPK